MMETNVDSLARDVIADPTTALGGRLSSYASGLSDRYSGFGLARQGGESPLLAAISHRWAPMTAVGGIDVFDTSFLDAVAADWHQAEGYFGNDFDFEGPFVIPVDPVEHPAGIQSTRVRKPRRRGRTLRPVAARRARPKAPPPEAERALIQPPAATRTQPAERWRPVEGDRLSPYPAAMGRAGAIEAPLLRFPEAVAQSFADQADVVIAGQGPARDWGVGPSVAPAARGAEALLALVESRQVATAPQPVSTWLVPSAATPAARGQIAQRTTTQRPGRWSPALDTWAAPLIGLAPEAPAPLADDPLGAAPITQIDLDQPAPWVAPTIAPAPRFAATGPAGELIQARRSAAPVSSALGRGQQTSVPSRARQVARSRQPIASTRSVAQTPSGDAPGQGAPPVRSGMGASVSPSLVSAGLPLTSGAAPWAPRAVFREPASARPLVARRAIGQSAVLAPTVRLPGHGAIGPAGTPIVPGQNPFGAAPAGTPTLAGPAPLASAPRTSAAVWDAAERTLVQPVRLPVAVQAALQSPASPAAARRAATGSVVSAPQPPQVSSAQSPIAPALPSAARAVAPVKLPAAVARTLETDRSRTADATRSLVARLSASPALVQAVAARTAAAGLIRTAPRPVVTAGSGTAMPAGSVAPPPFGPRGAAPLPQLGQSTARPMVATPAVLSRFARPASAPTPTFWPGAGTGEFIRPVADVAPVAASTTTPAARRAPALAAQPSRAVASSLAAAPAVLAPTPMVPPVVLPPVVARALAAAGVEPGQLVAALPGLSASPITLAAAVQALPSARLPGLADVAADRAALPPLVERILGRDASAPRGVQGPAIQTSWPDTMARAAAADQGAPGALVEPVAQDAPVDRSTSEFARQAARSRTVSQLAAQTDPTLTRVTQPGVAERATPWAPAPETATSARLQAFVAALAMRVDDAHRVRTPRVMESAFDLGPATLVEPVAEPEMSPTIQPAPGRIARSPRPRPRLPAPIGTHGQRTQQMAARVAAGQSIGPRAMPAEPTAQTRPRTVGLSPGAPAETPVAEAAQAPPGVGRWPANLRRLVQAYQVAELEAAGVTPERWLATPAPVQAQLLESLEAAGVNAVRTTMDADVVTAAPRPARAPSQPGAVGMQALGLEAQIVQRGDLPALRARLEQVTARPSASPVAADLDAPLIAPPRAVPQVGAASVARQVAQAARAWSGWQAPPPRIAPLAAPRRSAAPSPVEARMPTFVADWMTPELVAAAADPGTDTQALRGAIATQAGGALVAPNVARPRPTAQRHGPRRRAFDRPKLALDNVDRAMVAFEQSLDKAGPRARASYPDVSPAAVVSAPGPIVRGETPPAPRAAKPAPALTGSLFGDRGPQSIVAPGAARVMVETGSHGVEQALHSTPGERPGTKTETNEEARHRNADQISGSLSPEEVERVAEEVTTKLVAQLEADRIRFGMGDDGWD